MEDGVSWWRRYRLKILSSFLIIGGLTTVLMLARAVSTGTWPFTVAGDYSVYKGDGTADTGNTKIIVSGGVVKLVGSAASAVEDTTAEYTASGSSFAGTTAGPDANLTLTKTGSNYNTPGTYTSQVFDGGVGNTWQQIKADVQNLVLPSNQGLELSASEPNLLALWHMNEASWTLGSATILDAGTNNRDGTPQNCGASVTEAVFGAKGGQLTGGTTCRIDFSNPGSIQTSEFWIKHGASNGGLLRFAASNTVSTSGRTVTALGLVNATIYVNGVAGTELSPGWNHVAVTHNAEGASTGQIGRGSAYFLGNLDEVSIYNVKLAASTIKAHYQKGHAVRYKVRSGTSLPLTGSFVGPDGTTGSSYAAEETLVAGGGFDPSHRYLQYEVTLRSSADLQTAPAIDWMQIVGTNGSSTLSSLNHFDGGAYTSNTVAEEDVNDLSSVVSLGKKGSGGTTSYGTYTSAVLNGGAATDDWNSIAWETAADEPLDSGLLARWHFENSWTDAVGGLSGTLVGGPTFTASGYFGSAASFSTANQNASYGNVGSVKTVEFWIKDTNSIDGVLELIDTTVRVNIASNGITTVGFTSPTVYVNGRTGWNALGPGWNHVVVTSATAVSATGFNIGEANGDFMAGQLDAVSVYSTQKTAAEVAAMYQRSLPSFGKPAIKFQARAGTANPPTGDFVGPDGTTATFYETASGSSFASQFVDKQYFQYRAYFSADALAGTGAVLAIPPALEKATVTYNTSSTFVDDSRAEFDAGTYDGTAWNADIVWLPEVDGAFPTTGTLTYTSRVVDLGSPYDGGYIEWGEGSQGYGEGLVAATVAAASVATDSPGLGHLYKFENNWSDSKGTNNGTAAGDATYTTGMTGTGATFDGTGDSVSFANVGSVKTVEFWIKNTNAADGILELIDNATYLSLATGAVTATGFSSPKIYVNGALGVTSLGSGWNHVVVTTGTVVSATGFTIGEANLDTMQGQLDEVALYTRELSPGEIFQHMMATMPDHGVTALFAMDNTWNDTAGTATNGTAAGGVGFDSVDAKFGGYAGLFDGVDDAVTVGNVGSVGAIEFWIKDSNATDGILELVNSANYVSISSGAVATAGLTNATVYVNGSAASAALSAGWNHVAISGFTKVNAASVTLGEANGDFMAGRLDDVALYDRPLLPYEIVQHYERGMLDVKMQVSQDGLTWTNHNGATGQYATVSPSTLALGAGTDTTMRYRLTLSTGDSARTPLFQGFKINRTVMPADDPYVIPNTGLAYTSYLETFTQTLGAANEGQVQYQISNNNGTTWYWWNGSAWAATTLGYTNSNSASVINSNILTFYEQIGAGTLKFKAFLHSNGVQAVELSQLDVTYAPGQITVSLPNGGETWTANTTRNITWTSSGTVSANLAIKYSINGGSTWTTIASGEANDGTYPWTIPDAALGSQTRIRVEDATDTSIRDTSNANFTVVMPSVTVTAPNGGENWTIGTVKNITWTASAEGVGNNLTIQVSTNGGSTWTNIATGEANDGTYAWTVMDTTDTNSTVQIKIFDASHAATVDTSNANFTIVEPTVTVSAPNGAESYYIGIVQNITWTASAEGVSNNLTIQLSSNNGTSWTNIATAEANDGTYAWTVTDITNDSSTCLIRIFDANRVGTTDDSNAVFTVLEPKVTVTAPNGAETWYYGEAKTITWTSVGPVSNNLKIEYSTDSGTTWRTPALGTAELNDGSFTWNIADLGDLSYATALVKVTDSNRVDTSDSSNAVFNLNEPSVTLTAPNGAETWYFGESKTITWTSLGPVSANLTLKYSTNGGTSYDFTIATGEANDGTKTWVIPDLGTTNTTVKVQIVDANRLTTSDVSNATFTAKEPTLTVTAPNGTESWKMGTTQNITWTSDPGVSNNLTLEYSMNGGTTWEVPVIGSGVTNNGSYPWVIPDLGNSANSTVKVRVTDGARTATKDSSDANFTIALPTLSVTVPNGGEDWVMGTAKTITWSTVGTFSNNLTIQQSTDNGTSYSNLSTAEMNDGTYSLTVGNLPSNSSQALVKLFDANRTNATDTSNATFTIRGPAITVTSPNGTEVWYMNTPHDITWTTEAGVSNNLTLQYSTDGGTTWTNIATVQTNDGIYPAWSVPALAGTNTTAKVRIFDASRAASTDDSNANFTIKDPTITVTAPNGTENWFMGTTQTITWTADPGVSNNLKLEYSLDAGVSWVATPIATGEANDGTYAWAIPTLAGSDSDIRVKITDVNRTTTTDSSNANFTIALPGIAVLTPNGFESWKMGTTQNITWSSDPGVNANLTIEYSIDGGTSWVAPPIATGEANDGTYAWSVPVLANTNSTVKVKITDAGRTATVDSSNANFTIALPIITVTAPNGSEIWYAGESNNITWTTEGGVGNSLTLQRSTDGGTTWTDIATAEANDGTFAWALPDLGSSVTTCRVKIKDPTHALINDVSNANFEIRRPTITVTAPNGGEYWLNNGPQTITWSATQTSNNLTIEYSSDNGTTWSTIATGEANDGTYAWAVPSTINSTQVKVRVRDADHPIATDLSNAVLTVARGKLTVSAPNGAEGWYVGEQKDITWTSQGLVDNNLTIQYSVNGGTSWTTISTGQANDGIYNGWLVPDQVGTNVLVRLFDANQTVVSDSSNAAFSILVPVITITAPLAADHFIASSSRTISWTSSPGVSNGLVIEYSTDNGTTWRTPPIGSNEANDGTFAWLVPATVTTTAKVRIYDNGRPATVASSPTFFIDPVPEIILSAPNGGESWYANSANAITWTTVGSVSNNLEIRYSTDNGATWPAGQIIATGESNDGTYSWNIPATLTGTSMKVKMTDLTAPSANDTSLNAFAIQAPVITLTSPTGGETWTATSSHTVTWTSTAGINANKLKMEYSNDGGATWLVLSTLEANDGSYTWNPLPDISSAQVKFRISDADPPNTSATSGNLSIVPPSITLSTPNGGESWIVGTLHDVLWSSSDMVSNNLTIQYSADGGTTWNAVATAQANDGIYSWNVSDNVTGTAKVRILDADRAATTDSSNANFTIATPTITVTAPVGGENWLAGTPKTITWTSVGTISNNLMISVSTDGGTTYSVVSTAQANDGSYLWTVNDSVSAQARIKVSDANRPSAFGASPANFTIASPIITVTSPAAGALWKVGTVHDITWTSSPEGISNLLTLQYSSDGGATWMGISTNQANDGIFPTWAIPDAVSATVLVRIFDQQRTATVGTSGTLSITDPTVTLTVPNGGESWIAGTEHDITWTSEGTVVNDLVLEYSTDGTNWTAFASNELNDGLYKWQVADAVSGTVKVRVRSASRAAVTDASNANFTIALPILTVTAPNGGEQFAMNRNMTITWTTTGAFSNNLTLQYSLDGGSTYTTIKEGEINDGTYTWAIPATLSPSDVTTARIKVFDGSRSTAFDSSNANFTIFTQAVVTVSSPNGGEDWIMGTLHDIIWTSSVGISNNLRIRYSANGGTTWTTIASGEANDGIYPNWQVPNTEGSQYLIEITDMDSPSSFDRSNTTFTVSTSTITVMAPTAGAFWKVGSAQTITWVSVGTVAANSLTLQYSLDNGTSWTNIATAEANDGNYNWLSVPNVASSAQAKIKIFDATHVATTGASSAFTLGADLRVTAPNGAERWFAKNTHTLTWSTLTGTAANVKLEYSTDNGSTWTLVSASTANDGSETWIVPDTHMTSATAKIRVSDALVTSVNDVSDGGFTIDYYDVSWNVRMKDPPQDYFEMLSVVDSSGWGETDLTSRNATNPQIAVPIVHSYPYGIYTSTWSRVDYNDGTLRNWKADADKSFTVDLSTATRSPDYIVKSNFLYDAPSDSFKITCWMERGGIMRPDPSDCRVRIYDSAGVEKKNLYSTSPDARGVFWLSWSTAGILENQSYFALAEMTYSGTLFSSGMTYTLSIPKKLNQLGIDLATYTTSILNGISNLDSSLTSKTNQVLSQITSTETTLANQITTSTTNIRNDIALVKTDVVAILEDTGVDLPALMGAKTNEVKTALITELAKGTRAQLLNRPTSIKSGDTLTIRYRTLTGLAPKVDVYDANNTLRVGLGNMSEVGTTGVYEFDLTANPVWGLGDYTIVCSESIKQSVDSMVLTVMNTDLATITANIADVDADIVALAGNVSGLRADLGLVANDVTTILSHWQNYSAASLKTDINALINKFGSPTDASTTATVFGRVKFLQDKWGTQDAQRIYDMALNSYNQGITVQNDLKNSVGVLTDATVQLKDITAQIDPAVTRLKNGVTEMEGRVGQLRDAANLVDSKIAAMQAAADDVKKTAAGMSAELKASAADVKATVATKSGEILGRVESVSSRLDTKSTELSGKLESKSAEILTKLGTTSTEIAGKLDTTSTSLTEKLRSTSAELTGTLDSTSAALTEQLESESAAIIAEIDTKSAEILGILGTTSSGTLGKTLDTLTSKLNTLSGVVDTIDVDLDTIGSDTADAKTFAMSASNNAQSAKTVGEEIQASLGATSESGGGTAQESTLKSLVDQIAQLQGQMSKMAGGTGNSQDIASVVAETIRKMEAVKAGKGEGKGLDEESQKKLKGMQNQVQEIKAKIEIMTDLLQQQSTKPVIKTWFESGSVVLKIMIVNPSEDREQVVPVRVPLPKEATRQIVKDAGTLKIVYNPEEGLYEAVGEITLSPGTEETLKVTLEDIWMIPEQEIKFQKGYAQGVVKMLEGSDYQDTATNLYGTVASRLDHIVSSQNEQLPPSKHIAIYRENLMSFDEVKADIKVLEGLLGKHGAKVLEAGDEEKEDKDDKGEAQEKTITLKIEVKNPSQTEPSVVPLTYYLPKKIKRADVLDPKDLEVRYDPNRGDLYLFKEAVELKAAESRVYEVVLRDIWQVDLEEVRKSTEKAMQTAGELSNTRFDKAAEQCSAEIEAQAQQILAEQGKGEGGSGGEGSGSGEGSGVDLNDHIGIYVENLDRLNELSRLMQQMEKMEMVAKKMADMNPADMGLPDSDSADKRGQKGLAMLANTLFEGAAPDFSTTWKVIFVIIGFLGVISFLFYSLWWAQARRMGRRGELKEIG